jgi:hypothetical protein
MDSMHGRCVEYRRRGRGYVRRIIKPLFTRSLNQLAYLWGVVYPSISAHTGHTATELHEILQTAAAAAQNHKIPGQR